VNIDGDISLVLQLIKSTPRSRRRRKFIFSVVRNAAVTVLCLFDFWREKL